MPHKYSFRYVMFPSLKKCVTVQFPRSGLFNLAFALSFFTGHYDLTVNGHSSPLLSGKALSALENFARNSQ